MAIILIGNLSIAQSAPKKVTKKEVVGVEEDSAAKLVPATAKADFAKRFKTAKDIKWSNFTAIYMVECNDVNSLLDKKGSIPKRTHQVEYTKGGKNDGKWLRTLITYNTPDEIKTNIPANVLTAIQTALKKEGEKVMNVIVIKCSEKCIGQGDEKIGEVVKIETEGYYVHGTKTTADHTYVFSKTGEMYN
jgi:hypothetical protein